MRDWPSSNVRGTLQRHTRDTLKEDKEALPVPAQMHNRLSHKRWLNFRYKKGLTLRIALSLNGSLAMCYSRMGKPQTTIAANVFHFWVRNGIRWCHIAIVARQKLLSIKLSLNKSICISWYSTLAGQASIDAKECLQSYSIICAVTCHSSTHKPFFRSHLGVVWLSLTGN